MSRGMDRPAAYMEIVNRRRGNPAKGDSVGIHVAGLAAITEGDMEGVSAAGLAAVTEEDMTGVSVAGLACISERNMTGISLAGLAMVAEGDSTGVGLGGLAAVCEGEMTGIHMAGLAVVAEQGGTGIHVGGLAVATGDRDVGLFWHEPREPGSARLTGVNLALYQTLADDIEGLAFGGVSTRCHNLNGFAVGLYNGCSGRQFPVSLDSQQLEEKDAKLGVARIGANLVLQRGQGFLQLPLTQQFVS